ncbi:uncharacterized protein LOC128548233 [Mercenaria mercenaria]|uniref:uncharacterized protein LOC128548233 n=1 Tax=Mercenaria mercenaria TaxID=6596 RepID=UPI00234E963F|nr:uncharacterized protein LOC128548233 [Mercenaria mercenaria]
MQVANIVTLYQNKSDRNDCNNFRGISFLSIVGKLFAHIVLHRQQRLAHKIYPESQCFRSKRSTADMIFSLRQLQEKCREQNQPLYIAFIDLTKAFELVSRDGLFKMLRKIGCPPKLLSIRQNSIGRQVMTGEPGEKTATDTTTYHKHQSTHARTVKEHVHLELDSTATEDDAYPPSLMAQLHSRRIF